MLSLSKHSGWASARVLRQAQDDKPSTPIVISPSEASGFYLLADEIKLHRCAYLTCSQLWAGILTFQDQCGNQRNDQANGQYLHVSKHDYAEGAFVHINITGHACFLLLKFGGRSTMGFGFP